MKKLRVGFLLDDFSPSRQVNELIEFVETNEVFDNPVLITGYKNNKKELAFKKVIAKFGQSPSKLFGSISRAVLMKVISRIELKNAKKRFPGYRANHQIQKLCEFNVVSVEGEWSKSGLFLEMTNEDISMIESCKLDCIIKCGSGILRGGLLDVTQFGVISFHHSDNRMNRIGPSGFWEVFNSEPSSGFIIQKLNQELDVGEVLVRGNLMTSDLWFTNHAHLLVKSNFFMMELLLDIAKNYKLPQSERVRLHENKLYKKVSSLFLIKYLLKVILPKIYGYLVNKLISPPIKRWSVAYGYHNHFSKSLCRYKEIKNPKGRFLADPFVIENGGETFIFVEDLFYEDNKGRISVIKLRGDKYEFLGVVLEEEFHLSFPFVFKEGEDYYMIPESCKNSDIRLYKSVDFPCKWEFEKQLMNNVDAADTMLFKKNNIWFMLTNICSADIGDHQSELHIFYSEDFRDDKWKPIKAGNPVIFDPLKGRNGGFFSHNGKLYRVNQVHGQAHYGKSFCVNEIETLSKEQYIEKEVLTVQPNFKESSISAHHFHANANVAVVDFARVERLKKALNS